MSYILLFVVTWIIGAICGIAIEQCSIEKSIKSFGKFRMDKKLYEAKEIK